MQKYYFFPVIIIFKQLFTCLMFDLGFLPTIETEGYNGVWHVICNHESRQLTKKRYNYAKR